MERDHRGHSVHDELVEGATRPLDRLRSGCARDDQLGHE
jgi:hypothetical protein